MCTTKGQQESSVRGLVIETPTTLFVKFMVELFKNKTCAGDIGKFATLGLDNINFIMLYKCSFLIELNKFLKNCQTFIDKQLKYGS